MKLLLLDLERRLLQDRIRQGDDRCRCRCADRMSANSFAMTGSSVAVWPFCAASCSRFTVVVAVGVGAVGRRWRQDDAVARDLARRAVVLVVEEEERLVVAVPEARE